MSEPIAPHGGSLIDRFAVREEAAELTARAPSMPQVLLNTRQISDLELIATGAASPLTGFMERDDYFGVVRTMHLANGLPWSIPVTLAVSEEQAGSLTPGQEAALSTENGSLLAVLTVGDVYKYDKAEEAANVYRTTDEAHPGVAALYAQGDVLLGGAVRVIDLP